LSIGASSLAGFGGASALRALFAGRTAFGLA